jgi:hypothetical protein
MSGNVAVWSRPFRRHPGVAETVIVLRDDPTVGKRLVAYVVAQDHGRPAAVDLRRFLQDRLPEYMVSSPLGGGGVGDAPHGKTIRWESDV